MNDNRTPPASPPPVPVRLLDLEGPVAEAVEASGLGRSEWIRRALRAYLLGLSREDLHRLDALAVQIEKLRRELAPVGSNLNQLAYAFNAAEAVDRTSLAGVHRSLIDVFQVAIKTLRAAEAQLARIHG